MGRAHLYRMHFMVRPEFVFPAGKLPGLGRLTPENQLFVLERQTQWGGIGTFRGREVPDGVVLAPIFRLRRSSRMIRPPRQQRAHGLKAQPE